MPDGNIDKKATHLTPNLRGRDQGHKLFDWPKPEGLAIHPSDLGSG